MYGKDHTQEQKAQISSPASNWAEIKASRLPEDISNVAYIEKITARKDGTDCLELGRGWRQKKTSRRTSALLNLLLSTNTINGIDLSHFSEREPAIGMTMCGIIAILGKAQRVHTSNVVGHQTLQAVFERHNRTLYVYMEWSGNQYYVTSYSD